MLFLCCFHCDCFVHDNRSVIGLSDSTCDKCVWEMFDTFRLVVACDKSNAFFSISLSLPLSSRLMFALEVAKTM